MRKGGTVSPSYLSAMSFYQRIAYDRGFDGPALTPAEGERLAALLGDDFILMMENHGPLVVGASVGEALARIPGSGAEVAVLDVRLPDGSGVEVCREVRSQLPGLQCLMLTSYSDDDALFGFAASPHSFKSRFLPPRLRLLTIEKSNGSLAVREEPALGAALAAWTRWRGPIASRTGRLALEVAGWAGLLLLVAGAPSFAQVAPPPLTARSWLLLDVTSGQVIASHEHSGNIGEGFARFPGHAGRGGRAQPQASIEHRAGEPHRRQCQAGAAAAIAGAGGE